LYTNEIAERHAAVNTGLISAGQGIIALDGEPRNIRILTIRTHVGGRFMDKLVIKNIGQILSGKLEEPIFDGDCLIAIDGKFESLFLLSVSIKWVVAVSVKGLC
jgi:hypothetical protein